MKCCVCFAALTVCVLSVSTLGAGDDKKAEKKVQTKAATPGKVDLETLFKKLDVDGDGKISLEEFKKLDQFYKPLPENGKKFGKGGFDREKLKKLMEKIGGGKGNFDPETLKKMIEKFKGGKNNGNFNLEQLRPLLEQFLPNNPGIAADPQKKPVEK